MRSAGRKFVVASVSCLCLAFASACGPSRVGNSDFSPDGSTHDVLAPVFDASTDLTSGSYPRIQVGSISVIAPMKSAKIVSMGIKINYPYGGTDFIKTKYLFAESTEASVQRALSYLFEVNPAAKKAVKAQLVINTRSELVDDSTYEYWRTKTTATLSMIVISPEGTSFEKSYEGSAVNEDSTFLGWFPEPSDIGELVEEAFQKAVERAIQDRDSYSQLHTQHISGDQRFA